MLKVNQKNNDIIHFFKLSARYTFLTEFYRKFFYEYTNFFNLGQNLVDSNFCDCFFNA